MEIKFRAKATNRSGRKQYRTKYKNGDWVFGLLEKHEERFEDSVLYATMRNTNGVCDIEVDESTLGQFTGLRDKNGKEIYAGDIVNVTDFENNRANGEVRYEESACCYRVKGSFFDYPLGVFQEGIEVIGNIYDNPELLEGTNEQS